MKSLKYKFLAIGLLSVTVAFAGNDRKRGQAGASELMMNPWARSSSWIGGSVAGIRGPEAMSFNVAGIAETKNTSFMFSNTSWYTGSDIQSNALGFTQAVGENGGVLGISIMSMSMGEFIETTVDLPEGTGVTIKPQFFNLGIAYSKKFSDRINGGILIRVVNESVANISASGVAIDAGVQYKGGKDDRFKFGVSLRNVGDQMQFSGDGLTTRGQIFGSTYSQSIQVRASEFDIPTVLNIASSYDFVKDSTNSVTMGFNFNSNSYTNDRIQLGGQYGFKNLFFVRAGYDYYTGLLGTDEAQTDIHSGLTAGFGVNASLGNEVDKDGKIKYRKNFAIDYSYRTTKYLGGTHSIGIALDI